MKLIVFEVVISTAGIILMFAENWKFALGVMLLMWANNMMMSRRIKTLT